MVLGDEPKLLAPMLESCQHLIRPNGSIIGREISQQIGLHYKTLMDAIPFSVEHTGPAFLASIDGRLPLKHASVGPFLQDMGHQLHGLGIGRGHRVALVLPNGPELALAILAVSQWTACVPLSATGAPQELAADLQRCGANLVIGPYSEGPLPGKSEESATTTSTDEDLKDLALKLGSWHPTPPETGQYTITSKRRQNRLVFLFVVWYQIQKRRVLFVWWYHLLATRKRLAVP